MLRLVAEQCLSELREDEQFLVAGVRGQQEAHLPAGAGQHVAQPIQRLVPGGGLLPLVRR